MTLSSYLSLFPTPPRPAPRFAALCGAVLRQAADLYPLFAPDPAALSPDTAEGAQLDLYGALAAVPRPAADTPDADYRLLLRAKLASRAWDGCNGSLREILDRALPGRGAFLRDNADGTVTFTCDGGLPFPPESLVPYPAGIRLTDGR